MAGIGGELNVPGSKSAQTGMDYDFRLALLKFNRDRLKQLGFSLAPVP
jgi:hypothetical protein